MEKLKNTYRVEINRVLRDLIEHDPRVILIGQSIRDPYGGACKVTRGLTKKAESQIIDVPICEGGTIGLAIGMALQGYIPIVEIMFSDFLTLCVDQIYNVAMKVNKHQPIKLIIRTMQNNDILYGPTHSQDMTWLMDALPGVGYEDITLDTDIEDLYWASTNCPDSVIILREFKNLYGEKMK